ncbi:Tripartite motif-containing protein 2 [Holothuria leucospilota]|uniref:Tripartite motif-containing protein 2 n=1 Tax=Holothuria leucospilota TaxID=206669 RepID=A0A9Q1BBH1_HOLLE|nr:Tripartite motif-containing protein 2 [Holothuria leucospilota]
MATSYRENSIYDCPICCERYRCPKIISCGHSFCLSPCLRNLMQSDTPNCPLCRTSIQLPLSGKVEDLPTNFALQSVVEVSIPKNEVHRTVQVIQETVPFKQKGCGKHSENFVVYCEVCSELLCQKCLNESHNKGHNTLAIQDAVDKYCAILVPVEKDLVALSKKSDEIFSTLKEAKKKCRAEADSVRAKIDESAEALIQKVREGARELHVVVDEKEGNAIKTLEEIEAKGAELSLFLDYTHNTCERLKSELQDLDFRRRNAVHSISNKIGSICKDISELAESANQDPCSILYEPNQSLMSIPLGKVIDKFEGIKSHTLSFRKVKQLSCIVPKDSAYKQFCFLSPNDVIFTFEYTFFMEMFSLHFTRLSGQSKIGFGEVSIEGKTSSISLSSTVRHNARTIAVCTNYEVAKFSFKMYEQSVVQNGVATLEDALLYRVRAVSLDEWGRDIYALLNDGVTIKRFKFPSNISETFYMRLENEVNCTNSRLFHVTNFGMVICEDGKEEIMFYEKAKTSTATRIITKPSGIAFGSPVCIASRAKDKKWFVLWRNQNAFSVSSLIYQYSSSFDEECLLLRVEGKVESFCFFGEDYLAIDSVHKGKVSVSVYFVERGNQ